MFDQEFVEGLPSDKLLAAQAIIERYSEWDATIPPTLQEQAKHLYEYLRALAFYQGFAEKYGWDCEFPVLKLANSLDSAIQIRKFFRDEANRIGTLVKQMTAERTFDEYRAEAGALFRSGYVYEFSDGDVQRIQTLINELRDEITESVVLADQHKRRLIAKLEKMQSELHKTMSDLDRFWGFLSEAGIALGKFGKDVKPITDRVKEIIQIVWHVQARAAGLPSNQPLALPAPDQHEEK